MPRMMLIVIADGETYQCRRYPVRLGNGKWRLRGRHWIKRQQRWAICPKVRIVADYCVDATESEIESE
jgi:hypothetical protein